jgi:hypothetical protein
LDRKAENPADKSGISSLQGKLLKSRDSKIFTLNRRLLTFFFFLLLSVLFWFLTALNKDYETIISYPVKYTKIPRELVLVNNAAKQLDLNVQSRGFAILRLKMQTRLSPLVLDVNSFSLSTIPGESPIIVYLVTSLIIDKLQQQLTSEIKVKSVFPDTLILQLTEKYTRITAVKLNLAMDFERQHMQVGKLKITPDSVSVSGPENIIDTLTAVRTIPEKLKDLKKNTELELDLVPIDKLEFSIQEVLVNIPVEKFTEESIKIPIEVINIPDGLFLRTFPAGIEITYRVGLSDYKKVSEHMFTAAVDYSTKGSSIGNKLTVELIKVPEYVHVTDFYPKNVEYIIEK